MSAPLKRYRALIRDWSVFEVVVTAHDEDEAWALAAEAADDADFDSLPSGDGGRDVDCVDLCDDAEGDQPGFAPSDIDDIAVEEVQS